MLRSPSSSLSHWIRRGPGDRDYDPWFAHDPAALRLKLDHLSEALVKMNDGRGPDIMALVEVESVRAAELLRDALNSALKKKGADEALQYQNVLMKELTAGRHIAPAVITRLPVVRDRTRLLGRRLRRLVCHHRLACCGRIAIEPLRELAGQLVEGKVLARREHDRFGVAERAEWHDVLSPHHGLVQLGCCRDLAGNGG